MCDLRPLRAALLLLLLAVGKSLCAQQTVSTTLDAHMARLLQLRGIVERCTRDSALCTPDAVGPDERFNLRNGSPTQVHYKWLRLTLKAMSTEKPEDRRATATAALAKLSGDTDGIAGDVTIDAARANSAAAEVLSQVEFAKSKPSWFEKQWDRFLRWLNRHTNIPTPTHGTSRWLRFLAEAFLFGLPMLLLILWLLRQAREDRLRPESTAKEAATKRKEGDPSWVEIAQRCARRGEWREAVHALYWQTVTTLGAGICSPSPAHAPLVRPCGCWMRPARRAGCSVSKRRFWKPSGTASTRPPSRITSAPGRCRRNSCTYESAAQHGKKGRL